MWWNGVVAVVGRRAGSETAGDSRKSAERAPPFSGPPTQKPSLCSGTSGQRGASGGSRRRRVRDFHSVTAQCDDTPIFTVLIRGLALECYAAQTDRHAAKYGRIRVFVRLALACPATDVESCHVNNCKKKQATPSPAEKASSRPPSSALLLSTTHIPCSHDNHSLPLHACCLRTST